VSTILLLLFVAIGLAVLLVFSELRRRSDCSQHQTDLETAVNQIDALDAEAAVTRREVIKLKKESNFMKQCLVEFPQFASQLHSQNEPRLVPTLLLRIVTRIFRPEKALILLHRNKAETNPGRENRLVVAAVTGYDNSVKQGMEIGFDKGKLGFVACTQRVMSREDFQKEGARTRDRFEKEKMNGFDPHLASPMVFESETVGLIALSGPRNTSEGAKTILRLLSQMGAVALRNTLAYDSMRRSADMDGLTGIYCKRYMHVRLGAMVGDAQLKLSKLSVFLFDLDNFKSYNDTNGHPAGDELLKMLTKFVGDNIRKGTVFGRVGGEEFLIIFPDTGKSEVLKAAEIIRHKIANYDFPFADKQPLGVVSISGGVATYPEDSLDSADLLRKADTALYRAKSEGRNRVFATEHYYIGEEAIEPACEAMDSVPQEQRSTLPSTPLAAMPSYSQEEMTGIGWIEAEFDWISRERRFEYLQKEWDEFTFYVRCVGEQQRRGIEFSHVEIQECSRDANVQKFVSSLLIWMMRGTEPSILKLDDRLALIGLESESQQTS
jgi:diguanylate cyclase (GGDEF)-like protein